MLQKYKCHKEVEAAEILRISLGGELGFKDGFKLMSREWLDKHNPAVGGYYVVYTDGYESYSPKKVFEEGYTKV
jgi:hypothetical protein